MKAIISNFRLGKHTKSNNHMIILVDSIKNKEQAKSLIDKKVIYKTSSGKTITGKIASTHGNKGALRVIFERGMPGQSIAQEIEVQ